MDTEMKNESHIDCSMKFRAIWNQILHKERIYLESKQDRIFILSWKVDKELATFVENAVPSGLVAVGSIGVF